MTPGEIVTPDAAALAAKCGVTFRPYFARIEERFAGTPSGYVVLTAPANALARLGAYRIAMIALWPPIEGEPPESLQVRKAQAMAEEVSRMAAMVTAACERGEL